MGKALKAVSSVFGADTPKIKIPDPAPPEPEPLPVSTSGERLRTLRKLGRDRFLTSPGVKQGLTRSGVNIKR